MGHIVSTIGYWTMGIDQFFKKPASPGRIALALILPKPVLNSKQERIDLENSAQNKMSRFKLDIFLTSVLKIYPDFISPFDQPKKQNP